LQAWSIVLDITDEAPTWAGDDPAAVLVQPEEETAYIWIGPNRVAESGYEMCDVLMHEIAHVLLYKAGLSHDEQVSCHWQRVCNAIAELATIAYAADT
jgi:hypothetical protein